MVTESQLYLWLVNKQRSFEIRYGIRAAQKRAEMTSSCWTWGSCAHFWTVLPLGEERLKVFAETQIQIGCIDKWVKSKSDIATPQNLFSGLIENNWKKNQRSRFRKTPLLGPKTTLSPQGPPNKTKFPKVGVRVIILGILVQVNFLYNFLEFLQFFSDL